MNHTVEDETLNAHQPKDILQPGREREQAENTIAVENEAQKRGSYIGGAVGTQSAGRITEVPDRRETVRGQIDPLFKGIPLNETGLAKALNVRLMFTDLKNGLEHQLGIGDGRSWSIIKTKLEEACMFAVKAVSLDPSNQE